MSTLKTKVESRWLVPLITLPPVCPAFVLRLQQQALDIPCSQDLGPVPVVPGGGVIPTVSIVTSTVSRSVNSSGSLNPVPGQSTGINLPSARPPIVNRGSLTATGFPTAYNSNRPPWMFPYPVVGNPWQSSAALGAPNQSVSGGLCPTSECKRVV